MAINLSDNIKVSAPKPIDSRYLNATGGTYPSASVVCTSIPVGERYLGLTVLINSGACNIEYWFKDNVNTLIEKKYDTVVPFGDYITGASSMGDYVQCSSCQKLVLVGFGASPIDNCYFSENNNYFVDCSGYVRIGEYPHRGLVRRAYVNPTRNYSWIFNAGTGTWILTNYDILTRVGCTISCDYVSVYQNTTWSGYISSGGTSVSATGTLSSGCTVIYGAPVYSCVENQDLHYRSVVSDTPNLLAVSYDDYYVRLSGTSAILSGENIGSGTGVVLRTPVTGTTLNFRTLRGSGDTIITTVGNEVVIYAGVSGQTSITGATNIGYSGGTGIFAGNDNKTMQFRNIVGSGDTVVSLSGDTVVIYSEGGSDFYVGESPTVCTVGGVPIGYDLTGKTLSCIIQDIFVPELFPTTLTNPSTTTTLYSGATILANNSLWEIGCNIGIIAVCSSFSRGAITPQYCSVSPFRSGDANCYVFTGTDVAGSYVCTGTSMSCNTLSYTILQGNNTWGTSTCYDAGVQPKGSKGSDYCAPLLAGQTSTSNRTIIGAYPLFGTCVDSTTLTCVHLCNMSTANNVEIILVPEDGINKQKFEIPCAWLSSRPLVGVQDYNCLNGQWEYGSGGLCGLNYYCSCCVNKTIQGNSINYAQYSHCCGTRGIACIRLIF